MTKVKFCGLTRIEDILAANKFMPDFIGFVFANKSKRFIAWENAAYLKGKLNKNIKAAGVFVDEELQTIANIANNGIIDIIQLHGNESVEYIRNLRTLINKPVIKAIRPKTSNDLKNAANFNADYILFDGGMGEGKTFDWGLLKNIGYPYFLAGGLNAGNVNAAVKTLNPFAVDVSSGIETNGLKDETKMAAFMSEIRKAKGNL